MALPQHTVSVMRQVAAAICLVCFLAPAVNAQPRGNRLLPRYVTVAPPDQAEGARILDEFRQLGLPGDYYLGFNLEVMPRRGTGFTVPGQMWGTRTDAPWSRLTLEPRDQPNLRLLVRNGEPPTVWQWRAGNPAGVSIMPLGQILEPLADTQATPFDLQMPFVHWSNFVFEGVARVRGRTAHAFLLYPPDDFAAAHPGVGGVRIYLDMQFRALMQAIVLDANERPLRTMTVIDLKKVGDHWIVKSIDVRDEKTRNKTRFRVTAAALDIVLPAVAFRPESLTRELPKPEAVQQVN